MATIIAGESTKAAVTGTRMIGFASETERLSRSWRASSLKDRRKQDQIFVGRFGVVVTFRITDA
jgi:hypothetical protein